MGQQTLRLSSGIYQFEPSRAITKPLMLLGDAVGSPADRATIHLTTQWKFQSTFHVKNVNFMFPILSGRVNTEPILYVYGGKAPTYATIRSVNFVGGGVEFLTMNEVQIQDTLFREAATAIKASFVNALDVRHSDFSRTVTVEKCVTAFSAKKCEAVRIMDQKVVSAGLICHMNECRTVELCNITARDCGSMGKVTARNPVVLTGCTIEAQQPSLTTGLAGKILSVCTDRVLLKFSRGRIPPMQAFNDPMVNGYTPTHPVGIVGTLVETPGFILGEATEVAPVEIVQAPPPPPAETVAAETVALPEAPRTPPQWLEDISGWESQSILFTPIASPFASPTRAVSKMTPESAAKRG